jgi:membrane protein EpsK
MLALPIALMCGFAEPLLRLWLGAGFSNLHPLLFLMAIHLCINVPILPLLGLQLATNRVKVPAVVTMVMGIANLGLALVLAGPMHWNLYGIAAAGAIMLTLKNVFFTPIYAAHVLGKSCWPFFRELGLIVGVTAASILLCRGWLNLQPVSGWDQLVTAGLAVTAVYGLVVYRFVLSIEERKMVRKLVPFLRS